MSENRDQYNHGGMLAFIFSMVFVFVFFVYIVAIHPGVDLGENLQTPPSAEQLLADSKPVDISGISEPWVANADMVLHGKKVYAQNCAMCHGNEGKGDGAAGAGLNPKPRNLVEGNWKKGAGMIAHYNVLINGIPGGSMASYAHFKPADRWALVQFIDSITENKSKDDPATVAEFAKTAK
ncbi:MAG: cytochrome c [Bdellovibrio sp.]|jgi:mono/diheme cytochrome c family protein